MVFYLGIGLWAVARALVSTTWRDPAEIGRLPAGGVLAIGIASVCIVALVALLIRARIAPPDTDPDAPAVRAPGSAATGSEHGTDPGGSDLAWPDPESRPRF
jgi:hypothetical protein